MGYKKKPQLFRLELHMIQLTEADPDLFMDATEAGVEHGGKTSRMAPQPRKDTH